MNPQILLELVAKWESKAKAPECEDGSPAAEIENAVNRGRRSARAECAEELNLLIKLLARLVSRTQR